MDGEVERGHDPEVAAASPGGPREARGRRLRRHERRPPPVDDLGADEVVAGQPVPAAEHPDASTKGEATDTGGGHDPARRGQAVGHRRVVEIAPGGAALGGRPAAPWIRLDGPQPRQADKQAVLAAAIAGDVVPASANRRREPLLAAEVDRPAHILHRLGKGDRRRAAVDHTAEDGPRLVVPLIAGGQDPAGQSGPEVASPGRLRPPPPPRAAPSGGG